MKPFDIISFKESRKENPKIGPIREKSIDSRLKIITNESY